MRDAVLTRAGRLCDEGREVLDVAAVLGARAEPWLLDALLGDAGAGIDACTADGVLVHAGDALAFRHELAREAVLDAIEPERRRNLHAAVLAALEAAPDRHLDLSRLAHHAEAARDADAVLAYAPEAGRAAARLEAHREAAAQFARALRFAGHLPGGERAALLEAFAASSRVTAHRNGALEAQAAAARLWGAAGDPKAQGAALARLATHYVHCGRNDEAERASRASLELLEARAPSAELGHAYVVQAALRMLERDNEEAVVWGTRALEVAEGFSDPELRILGHCRVGAGLLLLGDAAGEDHLRSARRLAEASGLLKYIGLAYATEGSVHGETYRFDRARAVLREGIAACERFDLDADRANMLAWLALTELYAGDWAAAGRLADDAVSPRETDVTTRIMALVTLGRLRTRRGDPGAWAVLDEALTLADRTGALQRTAPVRAARAEAAWYAGELERARTEAAAAFDLALRHRHAWHAGELAYWQRKAGAEIQLPPWSAEPFALQARGEWDEAARAWRDLGCPFEEARALAESDVEAPMKRALQIFEALGARPAAARAARELRTLGARAIPRGPRPATRAHPAGLTPREAEVLELVAQGLTNRAIGAALHISHKTAGHHVSAILAKLAVSGRVEAAAVARRRGLLAASGEDASPSAGAG